MAINVSHHDYLPSLNASSYQRHSLHDQQKIWVDKNCYIDMWIELLHVLDLEPIALLPFTLTIDFEDDQWTFFKPPLDEIEDLYGINVYELTVWRPLIEHAVEHLGAGKLVCTEADAFWLPDTVGTDYRIKHSKTTILLANLNLETRQLGYFHNAAYFELSGEDFTQLFQMDAPVNPEYLPLFAEIIRMDRLVKRPPADLAARSLTLLRHHLSRRPLSNPFHRFCERFAEDLPELRAGGLVHYHAWAFASIRQVGAAFELIAENLRWLAGFGHTELIQAAEHFETISQNNKALILKGARAVNSGRPLDARPLIQSMAQAWEDGMDVLDQCLMTHQRMSRSA